MPYWRSSMPTCRGSPSEARSDQWGSDPFSENPKLVEFVRDLLSSGVVTIAEIDGEVVGASVTTDHPMPYVPAIEEPERYLKLLIASPAPSGTEDRPSLDRADAGIHHLRRCQPSESGLLVGRRSTSGGLLHK